MNAPLRVQKLAYENNKLEKRLLRLTGQAIAQFNMIEAGDKVMVCLSGGKDSYSLLDVLLVLRERAPIEFDIVAVNLDQKQPDFPEHVLPKPSIKGVPFHIESQDTYSIVKRVIADGKTMCSLCSRCDAAFCIASLRAWRYQDCIGSSSRRHPWDFLPEPLLRRRIEGNAAKARL